MKKAKSEKNDSLISINENILSAKDSDGNYLFLSDDGEQFHVLSECDAEIFDLLKKLKQTTPEKLKEEILSRYDIEGISLPQYLDQFVKLLSKQQILLVR